MHKKKLKQGTLKSSAYLDMQRLTEEHDEPLNYTKDNGTTKNIEELEKFHQIFEDNKVILQKLVQNKACLEKK